MKSVSKYPPQIGAQYLDMVYTQPSVAIHSICAPQTQLEPPNFCILVRLFMWLTYQQHLKEVRLIDSDSRLVGVGSWAITFLRKFTFSIFLASELPR